MAKRPWAALDMGAALFITGVVVFLILQARYDLRWSAFTFGDAQMLIAGRHFRDEGFLAHYFLPLYSPGNYASMINSSYYTHYPALHAVIVGLLLKAGIGPDQVSLMRIIPILFTGGALAFWYLLVKKLTNAWIAFFSLLYLGTLELFIDYGDSLTNPAYDEFFRFASLALFVMYVKGKKSFLLLIPAWALIFLQACNGVDYLVFIQIFLWGYVILFEFRSFRKYLPQLLFLASAPVLAMGLHFLQISLALGGAANAWKDLVSIMTIRAGVEIEPLSSFAWGTYIEQWAGHFRTAFGFSPAYLLVLIPGIMVLARARVRQPFSRVKVPFTKSELFWYGLAGFTLLLGLVVNQDAFKQWYRPDIAVGLLLGAATIALGLTFEPAWRAASGAIGKIRSHVIGQEKSGNPSVERQDCGQSLLRTVALLLACSLFWYILMPESTFILTWYMLRFIMPVVALSLVGLAYLTVKKLVSEKRSERLSSCVLGAVVVPLLVISLVKNSTYMAGFPNLVTRPYEQYENRDFSYLKHYTLIHREQQEIPQRIELMRALREMTSYGDIILFDSFGAPAPNKLVMGKREPELTGNALYEFYAQRELYYVPTDELTLDGFEKELGNLIARRDSLVKTGGAEYYQYYFLMSEQTTNFLLGTYMMGWFPGDEMDGYLLFHLDQRYSSFREELTVKWKSRNLLRNSDFDYWTLGTGPYISSKGNTITADFWWQNVVGTATLTTVQQPGDEQGGTKNVALVTCKTSGGGGDFCQDTDAEQVLADQTITLDIRAKTAIADVVQAFIWTDTNGYVMSKFHSGSGSYETLSVATTVPEGARELWVGIHFDASARVWVGKAALTLADGTTSFEKQAQ